MADAISPAGNQCASSSSSLIPSRLSTPAGSMVTPVSAATAANDAMIAARESTSVMSRSKPTAGRRSVIAAGQGARAGGEQADDQQDGGERHQHHDGNVPAPGGRVQQAHLQRARAGQQVPHA